MSCGRGRRKRWSLAADLGVLRTMMGLRGWFRRVRKTEAQTKGLNEWFRVAFDGERVSLDVAPPGRDAWSAKFPWDSVLRVCFKAEGLEASDGVYVFTALRPESYVIPVEARGGAEFWTEVIRRGLFDAQLAIEAASAPEGLFCWPQG